jgi:hypothetical protein
VASVGRARTRNFASPASAGFAFIATRIILRIRILSIRKNTQQYTQRISSGRDAPGWQDHCFEGLIAAGSHLHDGGLERHKVWLSLLMAATSFCYFST